MEDEVRAEERKNNYLGFLCEDHLLSAPRRR